LRRFSEAKLRKDERASPEGSGASEYAVCCLTDCYAMPIYAYSRANSTSTTSTRPWLARLRRALWEGTFVLHYQPILSLANDEVEHYEALVRLADEADGPPLLPGEWLGAAERYGLIGEIDRLVVSKAVRRLSHSEGMGIAVNLSARSIVESGMLGHIERELVRQGVDACRLTLEVTETAAISDMARARAFCEGAAALGCPLALDDFGVVFASFQHLKRLPFSQLKIDGEFIRGLCDSAQDRLMVSALVDVARGMGLRTVAEWVGDEPTIELLRELGVDGAQGFQIGRPHPRIRRRPVAATAPWAAPSGGLAATLAPGC
jgi:EAL domain-containing protein (putative c-di-GMP-specific phosphodiesterase class I)